MRIGLITNPKSGRGQRPLTAAPFAQIAQHPDNRGHNLLHEPATTVDELARTLELYRQQSIDVLAIVGGDGTLRLTVDRMLSIWRDAPLPAILPLGGGTMNVVVSSINPGGTPLQRFARCCRAQQLTDLAKQRLPLLQVTQNNQTHYGFIFLAGSAVGFLEAYYRHPVPGVWHAWSLVGRTIGSLLTNGRFAQQLFSGISATLHLDQQLPLNGSFCIIAACSVRQAGLGFKAFYLAQRPNATGDCQPHFLICPSSKSAVFKNICRFYRGRDAAAGSTIVNSVGQELSLRLATPTTMSLDGDLLPLAKEARVAAGPFVDLLTP